MMSTKPKVFKQDGNQRSGKGFSREELKKAGISSKDALRFGIPIDSKRKTLHEENVDSVKAFLKARKAKVVSKPKKPKEPKGKSKS